MFCAAHAAAAGLHTAVAEHGRSLGRKLGITGKGRCNLTNDCSADEVLKNIPRNPRFLYSALSKFAPADVMEYFENLGVPLKTERGRRVFPVSDKAGDIVRALERQLDKTGAEVIRGNCTRLIIEQGECRGAVISGREVRGGGSGDRRSFLPGDRLGRLGVCARKAGGAHGDTSGAVAYPHGDRGTLGG